MTSTCHIMIQWMFTKKIPSNSELWNPAFFKYVTRAGTEREILKVYTHKIIIFGLENAQL